MKNVEDDISKVILQLKVHMYKCSCCIRKKQRTSVPIGAPKCFNDSYTWETMIRIAYSRSHFPPGILLNMFRQINYIAYIFLLLDQRYMQISKVYQLALRSLLNNLSKIILCKISGGEIKVCYTGPGLLTWEKSKPCLHDVQ